MSFSSLDLHSQFQYVSSDSRQLRSGLGELDIELAKRGGIRFGQLIEWGVPPGRNGRPFIFNFFKNEKENIIWTYDQSKNLNIHAAAWAARGIDLSSFYFIPISHKLSEIEPLFLDPVFKIIVLDCPAKLLKKDLDFIKLKLRKNGQLLFLLRPFFLSAKRGNPLASFRFNCWYNSTAGKFHLKFVKGGETTFCFPPTGE